MFQSNIQTNLWMSINGFGVDCANGLKTSECFLYNLNLSDQSHQSSRRCYKTFWGMKCSFPKIKKLKKVCFNV